MVKCAACAKFMAAKGGETSCPKCSKGLAPVGDTAGKQASPTGHLLDSHDIVAEIRAQFDGMKAEMLLEFQSFKEELRGLRTEVLQLKSDLASIRTDMTFCMSKVAVLEARTAEMETYLTESDIGTTGELEQAVSELKMACNDREQESLFNEVEITGIPEHRGENLLHLIPLLAEKIGVPFQEHDINSIDRLGSPMQENSVGPRKIVIRFTRRITRNTFLQKARQRRGLITSAELGLEGPPAPLYFNERLTRLNRQLFAKARGECRHHQWRYCWIKSGRIYLRKDEGSQVSRIRVEKDLSVLFQDSPKM
ncbi:Zinc finger DNA binding protein [Operophtera brumata]|uniref:Zinc finger DNA binding protein n=1 Tax=Operophtera brumata TaxID=104452 RepID=A0A0L7KT58_OPEBR|nr:Zinc finger DNA binding protein [Operophtera brumata]